MDTEPAMKHLVRSCYKQLQTGFGIPVYSGIPTARNILCTSMGNWNLRDMLVRATLDSFWS